MPPINVLIKPASSGCNLHCKYCFYNDVAHIREKENYGIMSLDTLEALVKKVFEYGDREVGFAFQGGEPTLAHLDFYKNLICLQKKYNVKKIRVNNAIQTNGVIIDNEWSEFLANNNFLVGLSLDGPKDIHDQNRVDINGIGSYKKIEKTIENFNKYKVEYNILCVVTKSVARHTQKVYKYYSKKGFNYLQFIPCLDELNEKAGKNVYSLTPELYGSFLKNIFDLWYKDFINGKRVSVRMFDNIIHMLLGLEPESCDMKGYCSANLVIESDGSCYPCDFYVIDKWNMGNIKENSIEELLQVEKAKKFVDASVDIPKECGHCKFMYLCRGGCRRHYEPSNKKSVGKNYFCQSYKDFYEYAMPRFHHIASMLSRYKR